jgi:hypothetical protein
MKAVTAKQSSGYYTIVLTMLRLVAASKEDRDP